MSKEVDTRSKSPPSLEPAVNKCLNILRQIASKKRAIAMGFIVAVIPANVSVELSTPLFSYQIPTKINTNMLQRSEGYQYASKIRRIDCNPQERFSVTQNQSLDINGLVCAFSKGVGSFGGNYLNLLFKHQDVRISTFTSTFNFSFSSFKLG